MSPLLDGPLGEQRIVFMGDSTIRYLYLTVVSMARSQVEHGTVSTWLRCEKRCFWNEKTWDGWDEFYQGTSGHNATQANGTFCDCYRKQGVWPTNEMMENRFSVGAGGIHLDYLQLVHRNPSHLQVIASVSKPSSSDGITPPRSHAPMHLHSTYTYKGGLGM